MMKRYVHTHIHTRTDDKQRCRGGVAKGQRSLMKSLGLTYPIPQLLVTLYLLPPGNLHPCMYILEVATMISE